MIDISKVNNKLKYTEFYNLPKDEWNWPHFYKNLDKNIATNYNFLYTFKDKIKFAYLFNNHNIKLKYIKNFIEYYDRIDWSVLFNQNRITAQFLNKYYKKIIVPIPLDLIKKFHDIFITFNNIIFLNKHLSKMNHFFSRFNFSNIF